jgi:hypothetical protein
MMRNALDQRTIAKLKAELEQLQEKGLGNG